MKMVAESEGGLSFRDVKFLAAFAVVSGLMIPVVACHSVYSSGKQAARVLKRFGDKGMNTIMSSLLGG